ncbi:helix-turn-helix domain-containing protein [Escherichia coli]|uniref:helix-turn-helix domain-containing protein n=1 Tax=Escherichia coli TaxID=562 RepID=UPI00179ECB6D|nr:helix-turn-helix domain-containing protein [Escherichia coli]HAJ7194578.1 helix-turn-helix domain-containing protein [Escherichia coli]HBA7978441.1 helix-turn-helix domain containing protein [Escherichia coli]HBA7985698.1 helix-turn-helix domain containing protein [Escherichia coli]HBA7995671.1 helix-turn-helix domain containing protein [Escherichia coli]
MSPSLACGTVRGLADEEKMEDNKPVFLTLHEALRLDLIEAYVAREITLAEVAESMELTRRQCSRLIKRYRELGPAGLVSQHRGKPGNHQLNTTIRDQTLQFIRTRGRGMNPSVIWRILTTEYGVRISKETVRKMMIAEKTWQPRSSSDT